jgi:flagellar P-ring protein FlgI
MDMKKITAFLAVLLCLLLAGTAFAESATTRIKDIAKVQGVRSNQLVGYGLVVGLNGTGDSNKTIETLQSIGNMLKSFGVAIDTTSLKPKNVAAVLVTATLPPFVREGDTIDTTISSIGDAKSIQGGTLVQTPLKAGNGTVYAVAQGAVSTGGFTAGQGGSSAQKNFPTVGTTPNGAIVEHNVEDEIGTDGALSLSLSKPDFTTASRIAQAINSQFGSIAKASNPGRIDLTVPSFYRGNIVGFVSSLEELSVTPDNAAKVVVNERTGTIVMGGNVSVDDVAIAQGGLSISIQKDTDVSQPAPFSYGSTIVTKNTAVNVKEDKANTIVLPATANISDIVGALNAVGATPRDIISILQAIKASGALHADLEII